jgi:hypothetical protein
MSEIRPWPSLREEDRWLIKAMEERLSGTSMSPEDMRECARELREQAAQSEIDGAREAALALAERYEQEAASRAGAR